MSRSPEWSVLDVVQHDYNHINSLRKGTNIAGEKLSSEDIAKLITEFEEEIALLHSAWGFFDERGIEHPTYAQFLEHQEEIKRYQKDHPSKLE